MVKPEIGENKDVSYDLSDDEMFVDIHGNIPTEMGSILDEDEMKSAIADRLGFPDEEIEVKSISVKRKPNYLTPDSDKQYYITFKASVVRF